jgi:Antitoxin SocA-like, Panacea domain
MRTREVEKLAQIVAFLMKRKLGRDSSNYTKNLKLIYWANREALRRWERPITSDDTVAMPKGPALSMLLDLMRERAAQRFQEVWDQYFLKKDFDLSLESDPGTDFLSPRECSLLAEVQDRFKDYSYGGMIKFMHDPKNIPEYSEPGDTSRPIALNETLEKLGKNENQRSIVAKEVRFNENIASLFED